MGYTVPKKNLSTPHLLVYIPNTEFHTNLAKSFQPHLNRWMHGHNICVHAVLTKNYVGYSKINLRWAGKKNTE